MEFDPLSEEFFGQGAADPSGCAGHDGDPSPELVHVVRSPISEQH